MFDPRAPKTKTVTLVYPDNFDEWEVTAGTGGSVELICPSGCVISQSGGYTIANMRTRIEDHNRGSHATEKTGPTVR